MQRAGQLARLAVTWTGLLRFCGTPGGLEACSADHLALRAFGMARKDPKPNPIDLGLLAAILAVRRARRQDFASWPPIAAASRRWARGLKSAGGTLMSVIAESLDEVLDGIAHGTQDFRDRLDARPARLSGRAHALAFVEGSGIKVCRLCKARSGKAMRPGRAVDCAPHRSVGEFTHGVPHALDRFLARLTRFGRISSCAEVRGSRVGPSGRGQAGVAWRNIAVPKRVQDRDASSRRTELQQPDTPRSPPNTGTPVLARNPQTRPGFGICSGARPMTAPEPRRGMPSPRLERGEFRARFLAQFVDRAFEPLSAELERIEAAAWDAYAASRKSPRTRRAGGEFADPDYELSTDWLAARDAIRSAQKRHEDPSLLPRILLVNGSSRSEHTCPGEMSKSYRLLEIARDSLAEGGGVEIDILDLSRLASEYGRNIHPCKACFSTAAALCHWPCSCYPNYALGQTHDWMNDIYPLWVAAHGVMIITPVNWYQVSSPLKLMMDRLVCADGGNPDPTLTHGKDASCAKEIELEGWPYPRHLAGRLFSVVVHGDVEGAENVRRSISDWLKFMHLLPAGPSAELDRYIGYWRPYATSHVDLDADHALQEEVRNAARTLRDGVTARRAGRFIAAGSDLQQPRQK